MGYINIYVSNDAYLYVKNSQLFLNNKENKSDYPLEDINSIMIENLNTTISTYTLRKFEHNNINIHTFKVFRIWHIGFYL